MVATCFQDGVVQRTVFPDATHREYFVARLDNRVEHRWYGHLHGERSRSETAWWRSCQQGAQVREHLSIEVADRVRRKLAELSHTVQNCGKSLRTKSERLDLIRGDQLPILDSRAEGRIGQLKARIKLLNAEENAEPEAPSSLGNNVSSGWLNCGVCKSSGILPVGYLLCL